MDNQEFIHNPFNYYGNKPNQIEIDLRNANNNFEYLYNCCRNLKSLLTQVSDNVSNVVFDLVSKVSSDVSHPICLSSANSTDPVIVSMKNKPGFFIEHWEPIPTSYPDNSLVYNIRTGTLYEISGGGVQEVPWRTLVSNSDDVVNGDVVLVQDTNGVERIWGYSEVIPVLGKTDIDVRSCFSDKSMWGNTIYYSNYTLYTLPGTTVKISKFAGRYPSIPIVYQKPSSFIIQYDYLDGYVKKDTDNLNRMGIGMKLLLSTITYQHDGGFQRFEMIVDNSPNREFTNLLSSLPNHNPEGYVPIYKPLPVRPYKSICGFTFLRDVEDFSRQQVDSICYTFFIDGSIQKVTSRWIYYPQSLPIPNSDGYANSVLFPLNYVSYNPYGTPENGNEFYIYYNNYYVPDELVKTQYTITRLV